MAAEDLANRHTLKKEKEVINVINHINNYLISHARISCFARKRIYEKFSLYALSAHDKLVRIKMKNGGRKGYEN